MSAALTPPGKKRIRSSALALLAVALAFYFGFIALLVLRNHH